MSRMFASMLAIGMLALAKPLDAQASFGIVAGAASTDLSISPPLAGVTTSSRIGFAGGITAVTRLGHAVLLAPEVVYSIGGAKRTATVAGFSSSTTIRISFVEIPILFRYELGGHWGAFFLTAGPDLAFKAACNETQDNGPSTACDVAGDPQSGFKSTDVSAVIGAGVSGRGVSLSVRYDLGLTNISNNSSAGASGMRTRAIYGLVGISFGK